MFSPVANSDLERVCQHFDKCRAAGNSHFLLYLCSKDYEACATYQRLKKGEMINERRNYR